MTFIFIRLRCLLMSLVTCCIFYLLIFIMNQTSVIPPKKENFNDDQNLDKVEFKRSYHTKLMNEIEVIMQANISQKEFEANITRNSTYIPNYCNVYKKCEGVKINYAHTGDVFHPKECSSKMEPVAIIIPFRNRHSQLDHLLPRLHKMLQRQKVCYGVFVVEQQGSQAFNKGILNNVGFLEALRVQNFFCFIFHDVDLVPVGQSCKYECNVFKPLHMAGAVDTFQYRLPYSTLVGGVIGFRMNQYLAVNGYSNLYWGWGLEDDDMEIRMNQKTHGYYRLTGDEAKFNATKHEKQQLYKIQGYRRSALLSTAKARIMFDGVNSVKYTKIQMLTKKLFTHLVVDVGNQPDEFNLNNI